MLIIMGMEYSLISVPSHFNTSSYLAPFDSTEIMATLPWSEGFESGIGLHYLHSFRTLCDVELPIHEDFSGYDIFTPAPHCWSYFNDNPENQSFIYSRSSGSYYVMRNQSTTSCNIALLSPVLPVAVDRTRAYFYINGYSESVLEVGYLTDPDDFSSFVLYQTIPVTQIGTNHEVYFDRVTDSAHVIVFKHGCTDTNQVIHIYNISLDIIDYCEDINISTVQFRSITTRSARIMWEY